jgi:transposase-like protein
MVAPYAGTPRPPQPDETGTAVYIPVTNAIESLNAKLRRAVRARGHFPHDDAVLKLLYLVLNLASKDWKMPQREWAAAKAQFAILFEDRFANA